MIKKNNTYNSALKTKESRIFNNKLNHQIQDEKMSLKKFKNKNIKKLNNNKKYINYRLPDFIKEVNNNKFHFSKKQGFNEIGFYSRQQIWDEARKNKLEVLKKIYKREE